MMRTLFFISSCLTLLLSSLSAAESDGITGLWKTRDQYSDTPRSLIVVYEYKDRYYGRMIATYNDDGEIEDTILEQKSKAKGVKGHPPYCGLDFVYNISKGDEGSRYKGKIMDPQAGKVYDAEFWRKGNNLMVRGKLWIFGKTIPWREASSSDLPKGFSMSAVKGFIPVVPKAR